MKSIIPYIIILILGILMALSTNSIFTNSYGESILLLANFSVGLYILFLLLVLGISFYLFFLKETDTLIQYINNGIEFDKLKDKIEESKSESEITLLNKEIEENKNNLKNELSKIKDSSLDEIDRSNFKKVEDLIADENNFTYQEISKGYSDYLRLRKEKNRNIYKGAVLIYLLIILPIILMNIYALYYIIVNLDVNVSNFGDIKDGVKNAIYLSIGFILLISIIPARNLFKKK